MWRHVEETHTVVLHKSPPPAQPHTTGRHLPRHVLQALLPEEHLRPRDLPWKGEHPEDLARKTSGADIHVSPSAMGNRDPA